MTLLEMAITEVRKLPEDKQDAIAALIIEELEDERRWASAFASSQDKLSKLAQNARASSRERVHEAVREPRLGAPPTRISQ
jgi:hypothetical protein